MFQTAVVLHQSEEDHMGPKPYLLLDSLSSGFPGLRHQCGDKCVFGVCITIPLPGPTCRADSRSSHADGGSNGPGVDDREMGGREMGDRRWGVRAGDGCRMGGRRKDGRRKVDQRKDGRRKDGRRKDGRRKDGQREDGCRRDGRRRDVREQDGCRRECGRSGRGSDDGDNDRRGGRHTLHLKKGGGGERREERLSQDHQEEG